MPKFVQSVVHIAQLVGETDVLEGYEFEDCTIVGPAVVVPMNSRFEDCVFEGTLDALVWEISPHRARVIGAIALVDCSLVNCQITRIGIAGTPDAVADFRTAIASGVRESPLPAG